MKYKTENEFGLLWLMNEEHDWFMFPYEENILKKFVDIVQDCSFLLSDSQSYNYVNACVPNHILKWIAENVENLWNVKPHLDHKFGFRGFIYSFSDEDDALMFKLRFC